MEIVSSFTHFNHLKENNKYLFVDFYTKWCGPCKKISPEIEKLALKYKHIKFVKVDCEFLESLANKYNISTVPTFILFYNGDQVKTIEGANKLQIELTLSNLIS